ncbi:MAG: class I SAM-dependent methyltransferase [Candidatus Parabeggiatoa sp. nov. 1]|nr:MAG: class I SAM-dependent methyltransferase [Gammaproteobacteria bacterium]
MTTQFQNVNEPHILSHGSQEETIEQTIERIKAKIQKAGDKPHVTVERQLQIVDELAGFPFGCFLLQNRGLDGYWADYMVYYYPSKGRMTGLDPQGRPFTEFEKLAFDKFPLVLATQQRFVHFGQVIHKHVKDGSILASLPCGLMRDLLSLDFTGVENFRLVGIDIDPKALEDAKQLAEELGLSDNVGFFKTDAWNLPFQDRFTLLTSNGLNVYEHDDVKVTELYRQFFKVLAPGGVLVTSFSTPPPVLDPNSEWDMTRIDQEALLLQKIVFYDVLDAKWQCFRTSKTTLSQLQTVGFCEIEFIYDDAHIFPTVVAHKPDKI